MPLTDREVKTAQPREKQYKLSDEKGLYLIVTANGAKYWRVKYRFYGKEKTYSIGPYPEVSLKDARLQRDEARLTLSRGVDPSAQKQAKKQSQTDTINTLEVVAREWHKIKLANRSDGHKKTVLRRLELNIFPKIGHRPISSLKPFDLLEVLRKVEERGTIETAHKLRGYLSNIYQYAVATSRAESDPAGALKGAMRTTQTKHHSALTNPRDVGMLMLTIDNYAHQSRVTPVVVAALKCSALWPCRPKEIRTLEWDQVNWEKSQIETVSSKTNTDLIIPLAKQALSILKELHSVTGNGKYLFSSARGQSRPLSENGVRVALRNMGYTNDDMTPHGFRAMARTLLDEALGYPPHIIEQQLAHQVRDPLGRAYNRTQHLEQRRTMMQHWADYLDQLRLEASEGNVISANFKQA
ncbi:integrase arm-type DNA-binding domain-containing protein [Marinomonas rhizomae]|uniref:tyrosine-type recombinase/integrase n=1 Tax=Marinomonas rhizomae TaxID=491948 RepID=UPI0021049EDD|nr:integrase arm-type DNA-binding domain-containing protein [Marinomonas rhizomae]UTV98790.1 integrase arm-type DNA-binding domain-containing protein [Marinomonas rhizomae]